MNSSEKEDKEAASEIPDANLLWHEDPVAFTAEGKAGILEQIRRKTKQDGLPDRYCIKAANFATDALKQGRKSK